LVKACIEGRKHKKAPRQTTQQLNKMANQNSSEIKISKNADNCLYSSEVDERRSVVVGLDCKPDLDSVYIYTCSYSMFDGRHVY